MTNKIISVSGAQGAGKSTTIECLATRHHYVTDAFSTPRYVQHQLGYKTLSEVLASPIEDIKKYQLAILEAKYIRETKNIITPTDCGVIIVERNFIDIFAFALQWALDSRNDEFVEWVNEDFYVKCIAYQKAVNYVSILLAPLATFEPDVRRASEDSRFIIHDRMHSTFVSLSDDLILVEPGDLVERVNFIHQAIQTRI